MNTKKNNIIYYLNKHKTITQRPFVIEVLGTPNSGKTTAIKTFEKLLKKNDITYKIIYEAAGRCKIKNKLSPEFNIWTMSETIKLLIESYKSNYDIIICERGLLDATCWFEFFYNEKKITTDEYDKLVDYILLNRFVNKINYTLILKCSVEESIKRENFSSLIELTGSIVNETILPKYNYALDSVQKKYINKFKKIVAYDTTDLTQTDINRLFISEVFNCIKKTKN